METNINISLDEIIDRKIKFDLIVDISLSSQIDDDLAETLASIGLDYARYKTLDHTDITKFLDSYTDRPTKTLFICDHGFSSRGFAREMQERYGITAFSLLHGSKGIRDYSSLKSGLSFKSDKISPRYLKQVMAKQIGATGQRLIQNAEVLVIGAGGLGSHVLPILSANGVKRLTIVDGDSIELSNLNRQIIYSESHIGLKKADIAKTHCEKINPTCIIEGISEYITNKTDLDFSQYNLVVDCTDNLTARLEIAKRSIAARVKLVTASVIQEQGYISTLNPTLDKFACNHCFFEDWSGESKEINCSTEGVISTAVAMIASIQATECLKAMTNSENNTNTIIHVNTWDLSTSKIAYSKNPACQICS